MKFEVLPYPVVFKTCGSKSESASACPEPTLAGIRQLGLIADKRTRYADRDLDALSRAAAQPVVTPTIAPAMISLSQ